jgi:hypothetical protein
VIVRSGCTSGEMIAGGRCCGAGRGGSTGGADCAKADDARRNKPIRNLMTAYSFIKS